MAKYPYIEGSKDCCPCAPTIPDWVKMLFDAGIIMKDDNEKPDLIDAIIEGAKKMEEFEEKNTPCDPSSDPTHPSHYAQGGISVWDVIRAYTDGLNGVDAFNAGNAIKYVLRWHHTSSKASLLQKHKNGVEDLKKAKVYIDEMIKSFEEKESEGSGE